MGAEKHPFTLLIDGWALAGGVGGWETGVCGGRIRGQLHTLHLGDMCAGPGLWIP